MNKDPSVIATMQAAVGRAIAGLSGPAKHRVHNQEMHELGQIRRHGGYQIEMFR